MYLFDATHMNTRDVKAGSLRLNVELDGGLHCFEGHRKAWRVHLHTNGLFGLWVEAVNDDSVSSDIGGCKEGEALDVVPVQM